MKIFVAGDTVLLGITGATELIKRGHTLVYMTEKPFFEKPNIQGIEQISGDFTIMPEDELKEKINGCDGLIISYGVDEKTRIPSSVYEPYYKYNISSLVKLLRAAKDSGVKKVVLLGSYLSYLAKLWPDKKLYFKHPFIKNEIEQEKIAFSFSDDDFEVMVLELPYIFGTLNDKKPAHIDIANKILKARKKIYTPKGGTAMVTVKQVGECIAGAFEKGTGGSCYPVGMYNLKWKELFNIAKKHMGMPDKKIKTVPTLIYKLNALKTKKKCEKQGVEFGLNPVKFVDIKTAYAYVNNKIIIEKLGVTEDDIDAAISESVKQCMYNQI